MDPNPPSSLARDPSVRRPLVVVTEHLADEAADWLAERFDVERCGVHDDRFGELAVDAEALVVRTYTKVDAALLGHLPKLKVVGRAGVGIDNIDVEACKARGVKVVSTPDANTQAVVEYVLCLLCDVLRPRLFLEEAVEKEEWNQIRQDVVGLWQMDELVLGILGLGRIGKRVAEVARAIGFTVIYHDIEEIPAERRFGAEPVTLTRLFAESDLISIHIDGRPSNRGFVSRSGRWNRRRMTFPGGRNRRRRPLSVAIEETAGRCFLPNPALRCAPPCICGLRFGLKARTSQRGWLSESRKAKRPARRT